MKRARSHILLLVLFIAISSEGIAQWEKLTELDNHFIFDIRFDEGIDLPKNGVVIFAVSGTPASRLFWTANSGDSWLPSAPSILGSQYTSISIKDSENFWVFGGYGTLSGDYIYHSSDGGKNWQIRGSLVDIFNGSYYSTHSNLLFASSSSSANPRKLYTSNDEGFTWTSQLINATGTGFSFSNSKVGILSGGDNISFSMNFLRTDDGGANWETTQITPECWQPTSVRNTNTFFAISEIANQFLRSDDGGLSWDTVYQFPSTMYLSGCIVGDLCHLYIQTNGDGLWESVDEGKTWSRIADYNGYRDTRFYFYNNVLFVGDTPESSIKKPGALWRYKLPPHKPLVAFDAISMNATLCSPADTIISYFAVNNCDGDKVIIDTIFTSGSPSFSIQHDTLGREITKDSLFVHYAPTTPSPDTAFIHLRFRLKGNTFDTVMTVFGSGTKLRDSLSFLATLTKPSVTWEETTELRVLPDKAAANKNLSEIRFDVTLDADVLEPLTNYSTGISGATIQMLPAVPVGKLSRYPFVITGNNMTLDPAVNILNLPMRPYVSDTTMTTIEVSTINLNPQDPDYERCTLSATGNGTPFTLELMCGDSLLSRYLGGKPILTIVSLKPNPTKSDVTVTFDLAKSGAVKAEVLDVLGNVVKQETLEAKQGETKYNISLPDAAEGVYYVRLRYGAETRTGKFVRE